MAWGDSMISFQFQQRVGDFQKPKTRHDKRAAERHVVEQLVGHWTTLGSRRPRDANGRVGDERLTHGRSSSIASRISAAVSGFIPRDEWFARSALSRSTAAATSLSRGRPSGTIRAMGLSRREITTSSPRSTRSSSSPNRVFASNAVMDADMSVASINQLVTSLSSIGRIWQWGVY